MTTSKVAVLGCGTMGRGIMHVCAAAGIPVVGIKATAGGLEDCADKLEQSLQHRVQRGKLTADDAHAIVERITFTTDFDAVADADVAIESVVEELDVKRDMLAVVEKRLRRDAILGTNTSSFSVEKLSKRLDQPHRLIGLHFFNPVPAMNLVEIGRTRATSQDVVERCQELCIRIGKTPVVIDASPGYAVNRLLVPYLLHAIELLETGVADAEAIDTAMRLGCGHPMGPLALADLVGLDVLQAMALTLAEEVNDGRLRCPPLLLELVAAKQLGRKTSLGIYDYRGAEPCVSAAVLCARQRRAG